MAKRAGKILPARLKAVKNFPWRDEQRERIRESISREKLSNNSVDYSRCKA